MSYRYPINKTKRNPMIQMYPEEWELTKWIKKSNYQIAEIEGCDWFAPDWVQWATPVTYMYEDYHRWKLQHLYSDADPDAPLLLRREQFGAALRTICPALDDEFEGYKRLVIGTRACARRNKRRTMRMYRGIKHPDAYYIHWTVGRRPGDFIAPMPEGDSE